MPLRNSEFFQIFNHYPHGIKLIFDGFLSTPIEFHRTSNSTPLERKWTSSTGDVRCFSEKAHLLNFILSEVQNNEETKDSSKESIMSDGKNVNEFRNTK